MADKALDKAVLTGINLYAAAAGSIGFARRVFEDPGSAHLTRLYQSRTAAFDLLWAYYANTLFDSSQLTFTNLNQARLRDVYKSNYNLYRNIRLIYNPVRRLVDFYAGVIYPGVLSEDGASLPDGVQLAIPFSTDTPQELKDAIAQFWAWSNWQAKKSTLVRYGAALGSSLVELVDDLERGRISAAVIWPGFIPYMQLGSDGAIEIYAMEYQAFDQVMGPYFYRKIVTKEAFYYFKNYEPFDYDGHGAVQENPYGFVPAIWIKHTDIGSDYGSPAVAGSLAKIDELNSLASHVHDQVHKVIGAPALIATSGAISNLFKNTADRGPTNQMTTPVDDQQSVLMLKAPADSRVESLAGSLSLGEAAQYMTMLLGEIEQDHPELVFYKELRSMSQVTGPAASRLVGDVNTRVSEAMANYDAGMISLFRMAVAMGGMRANSGAWGRSLNRQQQKFLSFDLGSYESGDLDMAIMPRALLTPTRSEVASEEQSFWLGIQAASSAGVPLEVSLADAGWSQEKLAALGQAKVDAIKREQMLSQEDTIPATGM